MRNLYDVVINLSLIFLFLLLEEGFDESDIEELLNMPGAFYDAIAETIYARMDE